MGGLTMKRFWILSIFVCLISTAAAAQSLNSTSKDENEGHAGSVRTQERPNFSKLIEAIEKEGCTDLGHCD